MAVMYTMRILGIVTIVTAFVVGTTGSLTIPVSASNDCQGQKGFERADCQTHENFGLGSDQDVRFHEGTCQGGRSTEEFEEAVPGGCENEDVITDPGNSDDHRNDD
jgi:hypothetical protein